MFKYLEVVLVYRIFDSADVGSFAPVLVCNSVLPKVPTNEYRCGL